jgi:glycerol-3-phosphate cytidylyltransferase-like family protein|tara:strand:+ start:386 stop:2911 length:2526 start_codon:yes stop_codon:yes gene_type:complete
MHLDMINTIKNNLKRHLMKLLELLEDDAKDLVIIYPGRFHPFHIGHGKVYKYLKQKYSNAKVFIATSGKTDNEKSPFTFDEKRKMMMLAGVDSSAIVQTRSPYAAMEIVEMFDPDKTVVIYAISEKDMENEPRFNFSNGVNFKKNGEPAHMQKWEGMESADTVRKHSYIATTPTFPFTIRGAEINSASQIRNMISKSDDTELSQILQDLYNVADIPQDVMDIFKRKIGNSTMNENWSEDLTSAFLIEDNTMATSILQALTESEFSAKQIKMAFGILNDPRYKDGNYDGAHAAIEKLAKGLASHPSVSNALKRANEGVMSRIGQGIDDMAVAGAKKGTGALKKGLKKLSKLGSKNTSTSFDDEGNSTTTVKYNESVATDIKDYVDDHKEHFDAYPMDVEVDDKVYDWDEYWGILDKVYPDAYDNQYTNESWVAIAEKELGRQITNEEKEELKEFWPAAVAVASRIPPSTFASAGIAIGNAATKAGKWIKSKLKKESANESYSDDFDYDDTWEESNNMQDVYKHNEDRNAHSENILMLVQAFGKTNEIKAIQDLLTTTRQQGYVTPEQSKLMYDMVHKKYYSKLFPVNEWVQEPHEGQKWTGQEINFIQDLCKRHDGIQMQWPKPQTGADGIKGPSPLWDKGNIMSNDADLQKLMTWVEQNKHDVQEYFKSEFRVYGKDNDDGQSDGNQILSNIMSKIGSVAEGYTILPPMDRDRYQERKGLEGPFPTRSGKVLYYDAKEGKYYDPDSDMYLSYDEYKQYDEAVDHFTEMATDIAIKEGADRESTEYKAGAFAAKHGKEYESNPHKPGRNRLNWSMGHNEYRANQLRKAGKPNYGARGQFESK